MVAEKVDVGVEVKEGVVVAVRAGVEEADAGR